jgi:crotonobetainyl-CoA:carnitine CoA-transferase CaiB-like acyl-CoA transferase
MIRVDPPVEHFAPAPTRGQHTDAVLAELGYDADTIDDLTRRGAFGRES